MTETHIDVGQRSDVDKLKGGAVGLSGVLFLCVTGAAPLAVFLLNTPYTMSFGNGAYGPAAFALATIILTIFSIGYIEMAKKVRAAGGMYTFVSHGLGRTLGMMSGFSLMIAYSLFSVALLSGFAGYLQAKLNQYDVGVPWIWLALLGVVLVAALAYFDVEVSAKLLGIALMSELVMIVIISVFFFAKGHNHAIGPVLPWNALTNGIAPGVGIFFAFWSWVGFEAAPNYAEESKDPVRVIPIAVLFSCIGLGVLYTLMSWAIVTAYPAGIDWSKTGNTGNTVSLGGSTINVDYTHFVTGPAAHYAGQFFADIVSYLIITGTLACAAALGNAGLRYYYSLGREGVLPLWFGKTHPVHKSPVNAITFQALVGVVLFFVFWFTNQGVLNAYFWLSPQGVIWIVLVQALTALAVYRYFKREHPSELSWKTTVAPIVGFVSQIVVLALFYHREDFVAAGSALYVKNLFTIFEGTAFAIPVTWLGIIGVLVPLAGIAYAMAIKATNPAKYEVMGRFIDESASSRV